MDTPRWKYLLVTGSRYWDDADTVERVLSLFRHRYLTLLHGDARGLDTLAASLWIGWGEKTWPHPANWRVHGNQAGPLRNQAMVDRPGVVACLAFPGRTSRGTWDCVRRAKTAGIPVFCAPFTAEMVTEMASLHRPKPRIGDRE